MKKQYARLVRRWGWLLGLMLWCLPQLSHGQNVQFGNEWIVPGQSYYKIKVTQDGIYRLNHAYLTRAGISGADPRRFQLWRRGRELAIFVGGNQTQLDPTTYIEFYGQRNDGQLDRDMYKEASHQPHQLYSLFTDTAAYFLTWSATTNGRRMPEPTTAASPSHNNWLQSVLLLDNADYAFGQTETQLAFMPWADTGEGFLGGELGFVTREGNAVNAFTFTLSGFNERASGGAAPWVEVVLVGSSPLTGVTPALHSTLVSVVPSSGPERLLSTTPVTYGPYGVRRVRFQLRPSDLDANGTVGIKLAVSNAANRNTDRFRLGYLRMWHPQTPHWPAGQRAIEFWSDSTLAGPAHYLLDGIPGSVVGYDVTDPANVQRVSGAAGMGQQRTYSFMSATPNMSRRLLLNDAAQPVEPSPATRVRFRAIQPGAHDFLIVTSQVLMRPAGPASNPVANPVRDYARYRASAVGGSYDTLVVTSDLLYNQFHYGERSPLAVRRFASYMLTSSRPIRGLLLLGKGVMITEGVQTRGIFYRQASAALRAPYPDLVPASTRGGSDIFFTADWKSGNYVPRIPTGRVSAMTSQHVLDYLNKLKEHEDPTLGPQPWRKNILHLAGGTNVQEFARFQSYLTSYARLARRPLFGAKVDSIYRSNQGSFPISVDLSQQLNRGVALINYFGHASNTELQLTPTDIDNPANGYANQGKYPVFSALGCAAGNCFVTYPTLGEQWLLSPNKGAIGFLSSSDFSIEPDLDAMCQRVYQLLFNDPAWYGKPVAVIQAEVNRRLMLIPGFANGRYAQSMLMNTTWQGDPALAIYSPPKPDYVANSVQVAPIGAGPVLLESPRFMLRIGVSNYGKVITDSVKVTVERRVGSTVLPRRTRTYAYWNGDKELEFPMINAGTEFGLNTFTVRLDDPNVIDELNENNNTVTTTFSFLRGGVTALTPSNFSVVNRANVRLVGQSNLPQTQARTYEFEIDTVATFTSARRSTVTATNVAEWRPTLPAPTATRDSVVYYWRFRFAPGQSLDETWVVNSFRFINTNTTGGWSQSHYGQMASATKVSVSQSVPSGRWEFNERTRSVQLSTAGGGAGYQPAQHGVSVDNVFMQSDNCAQVSRAGWQPTIVAAVFEPRNLRWVAPMGAAYERCGQPGAVLYSFASTTSGDDVNTPARQAQLLQFLQNVPAGYYVALTSLGNVNFGTMSPALKAELASMGSQLISQAQNGDPLVMLLRKGFPTQTQERTFDPNNTTTPRQNQAVTLALTLRTREGVGTVTSTRIGPAQEWLTLHHTVKLAEASDSYTLRLIGYDQNNVRTVLQSNVNSRAFSLAGVSARQYPYLQLEAELRDTTNRTAPQLKQWLITYRDVPEGVVRVDHPSLPANAYSPAKLSADAASSGFLDVPVFFENVSPVGFPQRLRALATIREAGANGRVDTVSVRSIAAKLPGADSTAQYVFRLDVRRFRGDATIRIEANPLRLPEHHYFNNELNLAFSAPNPTVAPMLDVAFDGVHILNGDIVSASPEILVDVRYEDRRRPLDDPSKVQLYLTRPGQTTPQQVDMNDAGRIRFVSEPNAGRARAYYTPGTLPDGVYKLEAQARDMADNQAAAQRYAVTFEVINASSITNIFPYPNPVTSRARFVFTLTGSELPRNMKIQILTISGKVVREIMQNELGPLRIGNNITEYAWDGTDQFGDQLANGTYLYRVVMDDPQNKFEHRRTVADQAFKKGWGKLVLLR